MKNFVQRIFIEIPTAIGFRDLNDLISGTRLSYYTRSSPACHLDLIPYATACKWTDLTSQQRTYLLNISADVLGIILRDSPVRLLVLNGKSVVHNLERLATIEFESLEMPDWTLPRHSGNGVAGYAYIGSLTELGNISLKKEVFVLGYNHNIQSSFGVTTKVKHAIGKWGDKDRDEVELVRPKDVAVAERLNQQLTSFDSEEHPLRGIALKEQRDAFVEQLIESIRRIQYVSVISKRNLSCLRTDPSSTYFDPLKAAILFKRKQHIDEAFWMVFLFVYFGKNQQTGWRLARDIYGSSWFGRVLELGKNEF